MEQLRRLSDIELKALCIKNQWFTCGTTEQYKELFRLNELGADIDELTTVIYICSDMRRWEKLRIRAELHRAMECEKHNLELERRQILIILDALGYSIDNRRDDLREGYIDDDRTEEFEQLIKDSENVYDKLHAIIYGKTN